LAYAAENPYNTFHCHKTLEYDDEEGDTYAGTESKVCAGFLSLQHNCNGKTYYDEDGFKPSALVYEDSWDMAAAYEEQNKGER